MATKTANRSRSGVAQVQQPSPPVTGPVTVEMVERALDEVEAGWRFASCDEREQLRGYMERALGAALR